MRAAPASRVILAGVARKICIHFSQFSETTALCCKNISIMPELCLMLQVQYYAQKLCRHNPTDSTWPCSQWIQDLKLNTGTSKNRTKLANYQNNGYQQRTYSTESIFWSRVEGRGSRVEGRGSRVEGRGSRVEGRGSRVEGRGRGY